MILVPHLSGKAVAIIGLGKSGTATARALKASGALPVLWDDDPGKRAEAAALGYVVRDPRAEMANLACVVWSPGIPHTHPQPHPIAQAAREAGISLICDVELLALARPDCRFVGITGTNGKSTTTTLLGHVMQEAGTPVSIGGNLGTAALDLDPLPPGGLYVIELSSYQLELVPSLALDVSILLNITPDHLGRHGGMEGYIAAKRIILERTRGRAIIGIDDDSCRLLHDEFNARIACCAISVETVLARGISAVGGTLTSDGDVIGHLQAIQRLPGKHNWQNACAVFAAARALGVPADLIVPALATYPGLAHRQELVGTIDAIAYVNDSKATNADAAEKALVCYDQIYWIAGGQAKEGGIASLEPHFQRIRHAFLIGEAAAAFALTLEGKVAHSQCGTLERAVSAAQAMASEERLPGAVVLLSPACASWDQFRSFEHRGDVFRDLVHALGEGRAA